MNDDATRRASEVFLQAVDLPFEARSPFVERECAGDPSLREEVLKRIHYYQLASKTGFLPTSSGPFKLEIEIPDLPRDLSVNGYIIQDPIGTGGTAVVYRALHPRLKTDAALKFFPYEPSDPRSRSTLSKQVEVYRQVLGHDNVVFITDTGTYVWKDVHGNDVHLFYLVLQFIEGKNLDKYVSSQDGLSVCDILKLFLQVCDAIAYIHSREAQHYDLKPQNIRVTNNGVAKVIDFDAGDIASVSTGDMDSGDTGLCGTLVYASPEQMLARHRSELDKRSDIYSLGVICYDLLSGCKPFDVEGLSFEQARELILKTNPKPLILKERVPFKKDLQAIVGQAMQKDREQRYRTVSEFAADIRAYLDHRPVKARRRTQRYVLAKHIWRHPGLSATIMALFLGACAATALAIRAEGQRRLAVERELQARRNAYAAEMKLAQEAWVNQDLQSMLWLLNDLRPVAGQTDLRSFDWSYMWKLCNGDEHTFRGFVPILGISEDGRTVVAPGGVLSKDKIPQLIMIDTYSGEQQISQVPITRSTGSLAFSYNGQMVAIGDREGLLDVYTVRTGDRVHHFHIGNGRIRKLWFSPNGNLLAGIVITGRHKMMLVAYDLVTQRTRLQCETESEFRCATFSPDGSHLVIAEDIQGYLLSRIKVYDLINNSLHVVSNSISQVRQMAFSRDATVFVTGHFDGTAHVWDGSLKPRGVLRGHSESVDAIAVSPDGLRIATGSDDRLVKIWDTLTLREQMTLRGHTSGIGQVSFLGSDSRLVTASDDATLKVWDLAKPRAETYLHLPDAIWCVAFSPDGLALAVGTRGIDEPWGHQGTILPKWTPADTAPRVATLSKLKSGSERYNERIQRILGVSRSNQPSLGKSPDYRKNAISGFIQDVWARLIRRVGYVLASRSVGEVVIWSTRNVGIRHVLRPSFLFGIPLRDGHREQVTTLAFSCDGTRLASGSTDGTVKLWDLATDHVCATTGDLGTSVSSIAFGRHGSTIFIGGGSNMHGAGLLAVWDYEDKRIERIPRNHQGIIECIALSPDGRLLATGGSDGVVNLWDTATMTKGHTFEGHHGVVRAVAIAPDGCSLASATWGSTVSGPGEVYLWKISSGRRIHSLLGHTRGVDCLAFSPDGKIIVGGGQDHSVQFWDCATGRQRLSCRDHMMGIEAITFSQRGEMMATAGRDGIVKLWYGPGNQ